MPTRIPQAVTFRQRALGLFVIWQICFIVAQSAYVHLLPKNWNPGRQLFGRWAEISAQWQSWAFFSNYTSPQCSFVEVDLHWPNEVVCLHSIFEPENPNRFFHPVLKSHRRFNFEWKLTANQNNWDESVVAAAPAGTWQKQMARILEVRGDAIFSLLRWHVRNFRNQHPEAPIPTEVVLKVRLYQKSIFESLASVSAAPVERPFIRWRPGCEPPIRFWPIEVFDPQSGRSELYLHATNEKTEH